jgi:hypothetical protein
MVTLVGVSHVWSLTADGHRRSRESDARQAYLYRRLADGDALFESQRRMYIERIRRLEARTREREQDVAVLRARLGGGP